MEYEAIMQSQFNETTMSTLECATGQSVRITLPRPSFTDIVSARSTSALRSIDIGVDRNGNVAIRILSAVQDVPESTLEFNADGARIEFVRAGGSSSYHYLNNHGTWGVVFFDENGIRRLDAVVDGASNARILSFGPDGVPIRGPEPPVQKSSVVGNAPARDQLESAAQNRKSMTEGDVRVTGASQ